jgi:hypothetical protein
MELAVVASLLIVKINLVSLTDKKMTLAIVADFPAFGKLSPDFAVRGLKMAGGIFKTRHFA